MRDLMLWVTQWSGAVDRPDVVAAHDELLPRFVAAALHAPEPEPPPPRTFAYVDLGDLPVAMDDPVRRRRRPAVR